MGMDPPAPQTPVTSASIAPNVPTVWFPTLELAIDDAKARALPEPFVVFAQDKKVEKCGPKQYAVAASPPRGTLPPGHLYEIAFPTTRRHALLDIEYIKEDHPELDADVVIQTLREAVEAVHDTGALPVRIMTASGPTDAGFKHSFHVLFFTTSFTFGGLQAFMKLVFEHVSPMNYPVGVPDKGIYDRNRPMRMLGQTKRGSERALVPYAGSSDDAFDHLWCIYDNSTTVTWSDPTPRETLAQPPRTTFASQLSPALVFEVELLVDCLSLARATERDSWLGVGAALYHVSVATGDCTAFLDLWDKWSRKAPNYTSGCCDVTWATLARGSDAEKVGMGSLHYWAKLDDAFAYADIADLTAAPTPTREQVIALFDSLNSLPHNNAVVVREPGVPTQSVAVAVQKPGVPTIESIPDNVWSWKPSGRENYALVKERFELFNFKIDQLVLFARFKRGSGVPTFHTEAQMKTLYRDWHSVDDKDSNFITLWMNDVKKRRYETTDFAPPPCVLASHVFNTFYGFAAARLTCPPSDDMTVIVDFVDMLGGRNADCTRYLLNWMAALLQRPAVKSDATAIMLYSTEQGVGKTMLTDFLGLDIIGRAYYKRPTNYADTVFGRFADATENTILLCLDECRGLQKYNEKLKDLITSEETTIERKGQMPITMRSATHVILPTNNENVVKVENADRRLVILQSSADKLGDKAYFTAVKAWMDEPANQRGFFNFLMTRDIADFNFVASRPVTKMYVNAKLDSLPLLTKWLIEKVKDAVAADEDAVVTLDKKRENDAFREWAKTNGARDTVFSDTLITQHVNKLGVLASDNIKIDGKRAYRYNWAAVRAKIVEVTRMSEAVLFPAEE